MHEQINSYISELKKALDGVEPSFFVESCLTIFVSRQGEYAKIFRRCISYLKMREM